MHPEFLGLADPLQVHVLHEGLARVALQVAQHGARLAATDLDGQDVGIERLVLQVADHLVVIQRQRLGVLVAAIHDGGNLAGMTQAAARTLTCVRPRLCIKLKADCHVTSPICLAAFVASPPRPGKTGCRNVIVTMPALKKSVGAPPSSVHEQRTDRLFHADATHGLGQQLGHA